MSETQNDIVLVVNDGPYGNERPYNALSLALALAKRPDVHIRVFLLGDAVGAAVAGQQTPDGFYNLERMLHGVLRGGEVFT